MHRLNAAASSLENTLQADFLQGKRGAYNPRLGDTGTVGGSRGGASTSQTTDSTSDPFASQLTQAIEGYLKSSGQTKSLNTPLQIQITPQPPASGSTQTGSRQFIVTVSPASATDSSSTTAAATPSASTSALQTAFDSIAAAPAVQASAAAEAPAPINEVDAYWATQPPAVQALRTLPTEAERGEKAKELAAQGYSIDVPIMVWGYDPLATMITRKSEGYTWTPALGQPDPQTPPGISFAGMQSYDPTRPPAGSIKVSTDFGIGLEKTSPWASAFGDMVLS